MKKVFNFKSLTILLLFALSIGQMQGATQRYIYVGISSNYQTYKDASNYGFNFWGGTSAGVKSGTYLTTYTWDGRTYYMYRVQVYDDNNKAQFKGNDSWWDPADGFSVTLNGTTNNAVFFSHSSDGWQGQFQQNYQVTSSASLSASSTSITTAQTSTLTPSLSSNATYNEIKSTTYSVTTNPGSAGSVTSAGVFSATAAGTYTVTATITYNAKAFSGITKTATATKSITVTAPAGPTYTVNVALADPSQADGTTAPNGDVQVGATPVQITAPAPRTGYASTGRWTATGGVTIANATANPTTITATSAGTVRWTFDEDLTTDYYIAGDAPGTTAGSPFAGWGTSGTRMYKKTGHSTESVCYCSFNVTTVASADEHFPFKVYKSGTSTYYGNNGYWVTKENNHPTLTSGGGSNMKFRPYVTGTYEFELDYSTPSSPVLTVIWPVYNQLRISAASPTDATNTGDFNMTGPSSNNYTVSRALKANTTYTFKIVYNSDWYGKNSTALTRASNTASSLSTSGGDITVKTDVAGTYIFTFNSSTKNLTVTYPTAYTVTYGKGTGGATVSASATSAGGTFSSGAYVASGDVVTFSQTASAGYSFKGWYTTASGSTSAGVTNNQLTINSNKTVYAQYTANQYIVSFNNNGGSGATPGDITVTYGQPYGTLPAGPTPPGVDQFVGWSTGASSGPIVTSSTIVSTASNHTLYARFESTYTVTVQYKCGTDVLRAQTTIHASETSVAAEIIAPEILGYAFVEWTGDNATFADPTSATTTVNVTSATTVVANYEVVPMVYFKNNLDWDEVYVSFDIGWTTVGGKQVPTNKNKPYYQMTQLGTSDIFYCVIPSTYTDNNYVGWKGNIAFDNTNYGGTATTTHSGTWNDFYEGEFLGRADFDPNATMYIPYDGDTETRNSGTYYPTGCWLQYNTNYAGYKVNVWNSVNGNSGEQVNYPGTELRSDVAGSFEFKAKVYVPYSATAYGMKLYKDKLKNDNEKWYTNVNDAAHTITSETTTLPWSFTGAGSDENWQRCRFLPEVAGDYIFTVSFATGRPMVDIEYPVSVGDFRLVYKDRATWNTTHDASWKQISPVFKKSANRVDTASFFVSYGSSPTVELQKCTAINPSTGAETWTKQGSDVSLSGITSKGVYNFKVTQNADASSATAAYAGAYTGKYYVRTDASDGGWNDYKSVANTMTYTEYSMTHGGSSGPYSYYFMRHVNEGQNIKFIVANDYSLCLTDTMIDDTYAHEWIECEANVRFTWNHTNNEIHRAYISGSSIISDRFLVLEGDSKLFDADGHALTGTYQVSGLNAYEMNFIDDQNWIYETTVQAQPLERVKLTAKFNNKIQYFYGAEGARTDATTHQLIGGTGSTKYKMRVVYDFKTNRLLAAWLPNGDISVPTKIEADVMIIRYHQEDAQQITFSSTGKLTDVKTVYGAMEFNKYRLNNQSETGGHGDLGLSPYERDLYFISFPFDVKLNDVFGFGTYGKHWIIEYYDGKGRAEKGYWIDSPANWKFVTKAMRDSYTLKANEGYVLALDLDELTMESPVWNYGVENVYIYFPSTATVENIQATSKTVNIDQNGYYCSINRGTPDGDRRVKDSYWHCIGVPSYANAGHTTNGSWEDGTTYPVLDNVSPATWLSAAPYVYNWNAATNKFGVVSTSSLAFKPMQAYLVQYARDTLQWRQVNTTVAAPRRDPNAIDSYEFHLEMEQNGETLDHTFISLRDDEEVTSEFDFNYDLSKMLYGAFTSANQIYTFAGTEQVAANCLPLNNETVVIPVGVNVAADDEYTFTISDGTNGIGITLVDSQTGERTNLALTDYTIRLDSGEYTNRFVLEISPIEQVTTDVGVIEEARSETNGARKVMVDGALYIIRDNKVFDARGARIK